MREDPSKQPFRLVRVHLLNSPVINAQENQFIIGDGENWAKGGSFNEVKTFGDTISGHKEYFISGPSNLIEDEETNETIETPTSFYFGGGGEVEEVEVQEGGETIIKERITGDCYLNVKDSATGTFKDASSIIIENNSNIEIGKTGHEFTLFRNRDQNPKTLSSPFIRIQDATYMVIDASTAQTGSPVTLIHGGFLCDISDGQNINNNDIKRLNNPFDPQGRNNYGAPGSAYPLCPWTENGSWTNQIGPILYLHQNPTIMMENAPVFSMRGRSVLQMEGDAHIHLETLDSRETSFIMQTGSLFRMNGNARNDSSYTAGLLVDSCQLFAGRLSSSAKGNDFGANNYQQHIWNDNKVIWSSIGDGFSSTGPFLTWTSKAIDSTPVRGPQFLTETEIGGSAVFHLYSRDDGRAFFDRGSREGGVIVDDMYTRSGGKITSLVNVEESGHYFKDLTVCDGSRLGVKVGIEYGTNVAAAVTPHGKTSINFAPEGFYGYIENSHVIYKYISHPNFYQEYVDGDVFKQYNGYCHIESQDGSSLILRNKQNKTKVSGYTGNSYLSEGTVTILTTTDYSNLTFEDLKANNSDFTSFKNQINSGKRSDVYAKIKYESGGEIVSSTKVSNTYYSTVINNYIYSINENHAEKSWNCPIQSNTGMSGPTIQMYNTSNFLMRGVKEDNFGILTLNISKTQFPALFTDTSDLTITDPVEISNIIQLLETESYYNEQLNTFMTVTYKQVNIVKILNPGVPTTYLNKEIRIFADCMEWSDTEFYSDKPNHLIRNENAPTVEFNDAAYLFMTGRSELKLEDGTVIKAKNNNGTMEYTFGDESDSNNQVTFSINELKALKALLTRTWTGSESDYQNIQNPDSNTLYYTWDDNE